MTREHGVLFELHRQRQFGGAVGLGKSYNLTSKVVGEMRDLLLAAYSRKLAFHPEGRPVPYACSAEELAVELPGCRWPDCAMSHQPVKLSNGKVLWLPTASRPPRILATALYHRAPSR